MARKGKKQAKRLAARVADWNKLPKIGNKEAAAPNAKHTYCRKPGSNNK